MALTGVIKEEVWPGMEALGSSTGSGASQLCGQAAQYVLTAPLPLKEVIFLGNK